MSDIETTVYNCYRAALRSLKKNAPGNRTSRAPERKQQALRIASERFNLRIREVKDIVRSKDIQHGVTHEHTENYIQEFELHKAWGEALDNIGVDGPCQRCQTTDEEGIIRIRPNFHKYDKTNEMEFARHCYLCFRTEFGGYPGL